MRLLALIFLLAITKLVNAQTTPHRCNSDENHQYHYDNNEEYRHDFDVRKVQLDAITASSQNQVRLACTDPIIIPVAVHYEGVGTQTAACLEQLALSQIEALNADFAASNADIANYCVDIDNSTLDPAALAANGACIQFCLANQNHPTGFGLNNGDYAVTINQDYVANNNFPNFTNGTWSGYMNMFITEGTGVLGYAPLFGQANGDGVVIEACAFGVDGSGCGGGIGPGAGCAGLSVYNLGRTVTHEVGHYLGLEHIWGGGAGGCGQDDGIADTPVSTQEYYSCPAQGSASCGSDDMYMNYMDYVNDACMYMFSEGQATLMFNTASMLWTTNSNKCLANPTYPLATLPSGCNPANDDAGIIAHVTPTPNSSSCIVGASVTPVVTLQNFGANTLISVTISYEINSGAAVNFSWTGSLATGLTEDVTLAPYNEPAGVYEFKSYTSSPNGNADENANNNELATNHQTVVTTNLPYQEDFEDGSFDPTNSGLTTFNDGNDAFVWAQATVSANGVGNNSATFDNLTGTQQSNPEDTQDALNTPVFDFSNIIGAELTFDVAYAQYDNNTYFDSLIVMISIDCGENYDQIIFQDGATGLATAPNVTTAFVPANNEWNNISIDLSNYNGMPNVSVSFINSSGWGNNLYIDNINIQTATSNNCAVTATATGVSCAGNDGIATAVSANTTGSVTYEWSNAQFGATINGLVPGTYTVTILDADNCVATTSVVVEDDCGCGNMLAISQVINNVSCFGECDGLATVSATGGNGNYTYLWTNGATQPTEDNLCAGTYVVTVSDSDGCTAVTDLVITESAEIGFTTVSSPETCVENDGSAQVSSIGIATYIYTWSNGVNGPDNLGIVAGTYTVILTDINTQCTASEIVIVEDDCNTGGCTNSTLTYFVNNNMIAGCSGVCGGAILGTGDGGTAPYTYLWSNGETTDGITALCAGDYTVTVTDEDGCTYDETILVEEHPEVILTLAATPESCAENDGTVTATTGGNTTFIWSNGFTDNTISGLVVGTYTVTATDMITQCTATQAVIVGNGCNCGTIIAESQVISNVTCFDECDGLATITASGGTGIFTYLWDNGATQPTEDNLCAGTYVVTVSDSDGCTAITDFTISEPDQIIVTTTSTPESCATDDGEAVITNTNGGNYTYIWNDGNIGDTNSNIGAGTYTITITDLSSQCTATETLIVGNSCGCDGTLTYFVNNITPTGCSGTCSGAIGGTGDGGISPYTYLWSDGQTADNAGDLCTGNYSVTVTDANGCTYSETFFVEESTGFTFAASSTPETCTGNDGVVFATSSGTNVTFAWSNGESGNVVDGLSAGTYIVTATDASGCTAVETVIVEEDCGCDFIAVEITINNPSCANDCNGSALAESDITNGATYEWSNGSTGSVITQLCSGIYTVTATDAEGCTGISSVVINDPNPIDLIMSGSNSDCGEEAGSVSVSIIGGTTPFSYIWNNGSTDGFQEGLNSGIYTVTVTDVNDCSEIGSITITGSPSISVIGQVTNVSCGGESDGAINVNITGGTPPYIYDWDNGATTENLAEIPTGTYVLFVTDAEGCATGTSFTVSGAPELMIDMQVTGNTGGNNGSILAGTTGGSAPYTWQWSNGENGVFIGDLTNGTYTVLVTDANGCTAEATATVSTTTSTLDPNLVIDWSVYPNPNNGLFQLSMNLVEKEDVSIRVINILGQTIFAVEQNTDNLNQIIDIQEFSKGTYFLEIRVKESRVIEKLMLVK
jgi:hypothetical protein